MAAATPCQEFLGIYACQTLEMTKSYVILNFLLQHEPTTVAESADISESS